LDRGAEIMVRVYPTGGFDAPAPWKDAIPCTAMIYKEGSQIVARYGEYGGVISQGTDAATVIQDAIDYGTGSVFIRSGTYTISSKISVKGNLSIFGENMNSTVLELDNGVNDSLIGAAPTSNEFFFTMAHISLRGNKPNNTAGSGMEISGHLKDVQLDHVFIDAFAEHGVYIYDNAAWCPTFTNVVVEHCGKDGIVLSGQGRARLVSCFLAYNAWHGLEVQSLFVNATECSFYQNSQNGVYINGNLSQINGCEASENAWMGVQVASDYCIISNLVAYGASAQDYPVELTSSSSKCFVGEVIASDHATSDEVHDLGTSNVILGLSKEAAGSGGTPTAGNYWIGTIVHNTDDNTFWIKDTGGTMRKLA